jgi:DNA replication protein DnaC
MLHEPLITQLHKLGLSGLANAYVAQYDDPTLDFHSRFALLIEAEALSREQQSLTMRLKAARLPQDAALADVDLRTPRGISRVQFTQLSTLHWINTHQHLLLIGPTGVGKSYLACALARHACKNGHSVRYFRMPRLAEELVKLRAEARIANWLKNLIRADLIVLDDFGLLPLAQEHQHLLLELMEDRYDRGSVLITSQLPTAHWHGLFKDPTIADAIMDRIVHRAHTIELRGDSMRKKRPPENANGEAGDPAPMPATPPQKPAPTSARQKLK